jgi:hypothetical protein
MAVSQVDCTSGRIYSLAADEADELATIARAIDNSNSEGFKAL